MINDDEEYIPVVRWSRDPVCSCSGQGKPILLQGDMVICRSPGCRIHSMTLSSTQTPQSVETVVGNFNGREKVG